MKHPYPSRLLDHQGQPLHWARNLPIVVDFWDDSPALVRAQTTMAMDAWNKRAQKICGMTLFRHAGRTDGVVQIMVGLKVPENLEFDLSGWNGLSGTSVRGFGPSTDWDGSEVGDDEGEPGECALKWNKDGEILCASIGVTNYSAPDAYAAALHELGHALGLDHIQHHAFVMNSRHSPLLRLNLGEILAACGKVPEETP